MQRRISVAILAIGGQGGGVLADWLVDLAEHAGWYAQATSVPGVAQRTGATIYYVELFPHALAQSAGRPPVLALMPCAGDVDVVVAAELMEAGRAMQRGLVTPDRTTLIASAHRSYAIAEKVALGNGIADPEKVDAAAMAVARRYICFDMAALAEQSGSVISSVLFGAIAGAGVLPFSRAEFEAAIERSGVGVQASLRAFAAGLERAASPEPLRSQPAESEPPAVPSDPLVLALLERIERELPKPAQTFAIEGVRRLIDYQDMAYAAEYLDRLRPIAAVDQSAGNRLSRECARYLALRMAYEDIIRVADQKTRASRFERFRREVRAAPGQIVQVTEFLHPRVEEIADTMPAFLGRRLLASQALRSWLARRFSKGRHIRTATLRGFVALYAIGWLRRWRRGTLRHGREMASIGGWVARIERIAALDHELATEVVECARVIKGYGETHERGMRSYKALMQAADTLVGRPDAAAQLRQLRGAALADEDGCTLQQALQSVPAAAHASTPVATVAD